MNSTLVANFSCAFGSLAEVFANSTAQGLDVTQVVGKCENVCSLAWGSGNPDLSGIGANISYTLQTIFTFFFGAITSLWILYLDLSDRKTLKEHKADGTKPRKPHSSLLELQTIFLHLTAQFTLPIAIAALVRLKQKAPFFEISFMSSLLLTQFLGLFSTAVAWFPNNLEKVKLRRIMGFYLFLDFVLVTTFLAMSFMSKEDWNPVSDLAKACKQYESIGSGLSYLPIKRDWKDWFFKYIAPWWGIAFFAAYSALIMGFILIGFIGFKLWEWKGMPWFSAAVSSVFGAGAITCFLKLEIKRYAMRWVTGNEYVDDEWGFGQILAVCLWVPLGVQMGYYVGREGGRRLQLRFGQVTRQGWRIKIIPSIKDSSDDNNSRQPLISNDVELVGGHLSLRGG